MKADGKFNYSVSSFCKRDCVLERAQERLENTFEPICIHFSKTLVDFLHKVFLMENYRVFWRRLFSLCRKSFKLCLENLQWKLYQNHRIFKSCMASFEQHSIIQLLRVSSSAFEIETILHGPNVTCSNNVIFSLLWIHKSWLLPS